MGALLFEAANTVLANSMTDWIAQEWAKVVIPAAIAILLWIGTTRVSLRIFRKGGVIWVMAAMIDRQHQGIKLLIRNIGRANGSVNRIDLFERDHRQNLVYSKDNVQFSGFKEGEFQPFTLTGHNKAILVINAKNEKTLPKRIRIHVHAGSNDAAKLKPKKMLRRQAIYMSDPVLPPEVVSKN